MAIDPSGLRPGNIVYIAELAKATDEPEVGWTRIDNTVPQVFVATVTRAGRIDRTGSPIAFMTDKTQARVFILDAMDRGFEVFDNQADAENLVRIEYQAWTGRRFNGRVTIR